MSLAQVDVQKLDWDRAWELTRFGSWWFMWWNKRVLVLRWQEVPELHQPYCHAWGTRHSTVPFLPVCLWLEMSHFYTRKLGFFELHLQPITSQSGIFWTWHACSGKLMEVSHHYWTSPYFPQIFAYWNVDIFITWIFSISRPWRNGRWRCWSECCPVTCRSFTKSMVIGSRNCSKGDRLQPGELSSFSGAEWSYEPRSWCFM